MDYTKLPNPYDFANPVMDPELFAGRTKEINDISYYLEHGSRAPRAINLAIMGDRASGKTSVLNKIQCLAQERAFCVVRIDLDEGDARTQLGFFYKIFDSLLTTVCLNGSYGGLVEKTYQTYRNMIDAFDIPEDKSFCPFIFPFQYANASRIGNTTATLSNTSFKEDICQIQRELNRRVLLIFDECDVLASSRENLEKLRNIFMNTPGFMLVFAGTPKLFPIMDDVFSPIVRQFKKINLGPFETIEETEKCVVQPLEKVGIKDASDILSRETLREVHEVSGGRPYEIQLIYHFLFRRVQESRAKRLEINVDILDDVKKELETSQDVSLRPFLTAVRNLSDLQLQALHLLCGANNHVTFDQIWFAEFVFRGIQRWTSDSLKKHLFKFCDLEVLTEKNGIIKCLGDDFDRIYCKYFARKRKIVLSINDRPYDVLLLVRLSNLLGRQLKGPNASFKLGGGGSEKANLVEIAAKFSDESADPFRSEIDFARAIYEASVDCQTDLKFATVTISTPWSTIYATFLASGLDASVLEKMIAELSKSSARAAEVNGTVVVEFDDLTPISLDTLAKKVSQSANAEIREDLYIFHFNRMLKAYLDERDMKEALLNAELAFQYNPEKYAEALAQFRLAKELQSGDTEPKSSLACLVVPKTGTDGNDLDFEEKIDPFLSEATESAIAALNVLMTTN